MPRRIQGPDGVVRTFPDDATDEEIAAVLSSFASPSPPTHPHARTADAMLGFVKEAGRRAVDLGRATGRLTGLNRLTGDIPDDAAEALGLTPTTPAQQLGANVEQAAEFMVPAGAVENAAVRFGAALARRAPAMTQSLLRFAPRVAGDAATGAVVAKGQGADVATAAVENAAIPMAGRGASWAAGGLKGVANRMARAAIKPTVTTLKKMVGSGRNLDKKAEEIAQFIVDHRLTSADQAKALFDDAERELQTLVASTPAPTDAATRAQRYLDALERSAAKQGLGADDIATIRNAGAELLKGPMGEDVITMVAKPHPTLVGANGKPITVMVPQTTRQLRAAVPADEALTSARASSRWNTRKTWGEQKGAVTETKKAVERAQRDALKNSIPEARALLRTEGQALTAADVLDRMGQRSGNRDVVSLPATVMAAGEVAAQGVPWRAVAVNFLRDNHLKLGIQADRLAEAIARDDVRTASEILARFGVGLTAQTAQ